MFFTLFVDGCLHILTDLGSKLPPNQSGALRFSCTHVLGFVLEDGVQGLYRRVGRCRRFLKANVVFRRLIWYVWFWPSYLG